MTLFSAIQITSTNDYKSNISKVFKLIKKASDFGAKVVSLPETFTYVGNINDSNTPFKKNLESDLIKELKNLSKEHKTYLIAGSFHEEKSGSEKLNNTSLIFSPNGEIIHQYRKIHLFDANIPGPEKYKESDNFEAGDLEQIDIIKTEYGNFGLTICYDLRFPELYRKLSNLGAEIIFVPSAFTMHTGKDHWEVLLRARAIENQVYIIAPNQFGYHNEKRESYGNSMIIDPWGKVISRASDREEIIYADIDLEYLFSIRKKLPCLHHKRLE